MPCSLPIIHRHVDRLKCFANISKPSFILSCHWLSLRFYLAKTCWPLRFWVAARWADVAHVAHRAEVEGVDEWLFVFVDRVPKESVEGFANERAVLNEGVIVERLWSADPELHECERDPLVAFL